MKAILQIWLVFFTAVRLQRRLAVIGLAGLGLSLIVAIFSKRAGLALGALMLWSCILMPVFLAGGVIFREISIPRMHGFLPHFRARALCAFALLVLILTLSAAPLTPSFSTILLIMTSTTIFIFAVSSGGYRPWYTVLLLLFVIALDARPDWLAAHRETLRQIIPYLRQMVPYVSAVIWLGFGIWYMRTRALGPVVLLRPNLQNMAPAAAGCEPVEVSRTRAERIVLHGAYAFLNKRRQSNGAKSPVIVLLLFFLILKLFDIVLGKLSLGVIRECALILPYLFILSAGFNANFRARQARRLWLHVPDDRRMMYRRLENLDWRLVLMCAIVMLAYLMIVPQLVTGLEYQKVFYALCIAAAAGLCSTYLGLAATRGFGIVEYGAASSILIILMFAHWSILAAELAMTSCLVCIGALLVCAGLLRGLAVQRWRNIDWLTFKPRPVSNQALRARYARSNS